MIFNNIEISLSPATKDCEGGMQVNVQPVYVPALQGEATASGNKDVASNNSIIQVQLQMSIMFQPKC